MEIALSYIVSINVNQNYFWKKIVDIHQNFKCITFVLVNMLLIIDVYMCRYRIRYL